MSLWPLLSLGDVFTAVNPQPHNDQLHPVSNTVGPGLPMKGPGFMQGLASLTAKGPCDRALWVSGSSKTPQKCRSCFTMRLRLVPPCLSPFVLLFTCYLPSSCHLSPCSWATQCLLHYTVIPTPFPSSLSTGLPVSVLCGATLKGH